VTQDYTLPNLIEAVVGNYLQDIHTSIYGKIVAINYKTQEADVQPLAKHRDRDWEKNAKGLQDMPVIQGVPVIFPSANKGILSFPIKAGDTVLIVFSERSTENFVSSDGSKTIDPQDNRMFDYNDAFCIAGLSPFSKALGIHPENVVLRANVGTGTEVKVSLTPAGDCIIDSPTKLVVNATNEVTVNTKVANVNASTSVTIDSPQTTCTGELRVDGGISAGSDVQTDAGFSANNHKHVGNLSKPTSKFI
jgi:hypothetical protein